MEAHVGSSRVHQWPFLVYLGEGAAADLSSLELPERRWTSKSGACTVLGRLTVVEFSSG